jgi:hypothetical protein
MLRHQPVDRLNVGIAVGTGGSTIGKGDRPADEKTDVPIALVA